MKHPASRKPKRQTLRRAETISDEFITDVCDRLARNHRVRRTLPIWGRVHIDRQLPFLCVYRRPPNGQAGGTDSLVTSEASYVVSSGAKRAQAPLARLVSAVAKTAVAGFSAFLLLEVWEAGLEGDEDEPIPPRPGMAGPRLRIDVPEDDETARHVDALRRALSSMRVGGHPVRVDVVTSQRCCPPGFAPLIADAKARAMGCFRLGLEVRPVYRHPTNGKIYPLLLRSMRRSLTRALRRGFYEFSCSRTTHAPAHYHMLGRRAVVKAVWEVDQRIADVSSEFDFLLQLTPINAEAAWREFKKDRFEATPTFRYRPLPADPVLLKRRLFQVPIERVEDPVLLQIFREKQDELDRQITMLLELNTARFAPTSVALYGRTSDAEITLAREILDKVPSRSRDDAGAILDVASLVRLAEKEIAIYQKQWPDVTAKVRVRKDIAGGMMVSRGSLLVSRNARIRAARVEALLQHEVGTHIVTYYNGKAQPFKQLYSGLAGYESLQEGLAVLAEYLVGGLSRPRLRLLAARVIAVHAMLAGASFVETFRKLDRDYDFGRRTAYQVTMRVFRGGGLAKDAIYLRGLSEVLAYLAGGGKIEPLFIGKMAAVHIPIIQELQWRGVLKEPPLRPRFLDAPGAAARLERAGKGLTVLQLVKRA